MSEEKTYFVRIKGPFTAERRKRAGIEVSVDDGYTGPLTKEQLEAIKADPVLEVSDSRPSGDDTTVAEAKKEAERLTSEAEKSAKETADKAEEAAKAQVEAAKTQAAAIVAEAKKEAEKIKADAAKK